MSSRASDGKHLPSKNRQRQRRNGHQLVASSRASSVADFPYSPKEYASNFEQEEQRLAAMRLFLDSLQLAAANNTLSNDAITVDMAAENDVDTAYSRERTVQQERAQSESTIKAGPAESINHKTKSTPETQNIDFDRLKSSLRRSIHHKDAKKSMLLFEESQRNKQILPRACVTDLFFMVSETDPVAAFSILQYYNSNFTHQDKAQTANNGGGAPDLDASTRKRLSLYKRIANSISLLEPQIHNTRQMHTMIDSLLNEIDEMDAESKRILYPKLVVSLVSQRIATIGPYAHDLYESFVDQYGSEVKAGWLNRLLSMSRYNRQNDVPFHDIMARLVQIPGGQLNAESVLPAIQNMFPFTDTDAVCTALGAWLEDFRNKQDLHGDERTELNPENLIDLSTLESVSIGASQAGSSDLILLVWDMLEACQYSPTETIYENTIMTFANEKGSIRQAFAAMSSMKEDGFEISRPLVRSFSSAIRLNRPLIGRARRMLIEDHQNEMARLENHCLLSLESINVVLSSYAERGDPRDAVEILELMAENDIEANADSYSFVIEALGRDIKKRLKSKDQEYMDRNISIANTVLSMMEGQGLAPNTHVIRNYVELLCMGGEIDTATSIVQDYLRSEDPELRNTVNNITIYRVASEQATLGNFEMAKALADEMTEYVPALHRRIRSKEQRSLYLEETMGVESSYAENDEGRDVDDIF